MSRRISISVILSIIGLCGLLSVFVGFLIDRKIREDMMLWAEEETRLGKLPTRSGAVMEAVLYRGELPRGDVGALLGLTPRHARRTVSELLDREVLSSEGPRAALKLALPAALASRWMPGLFPDRPADNSG